MSRSFHRSRLFWLGVPGVIALVWGWFAFPQRSTEIGWRSGVTRYSCSDRSGVIAFAVDENGGSFQGFSFEVDPRDPGLESEETRFFPPPVRRVVVDVEDFSMRSLSFSHWFLLLGYLAVWLPALVWWRSLRVRARAGRRELLETS